MMPQNNQKNHNKSNSSQFELLSEEEDNGTTDNNTAIIIGATSTRGRPLKRTQAYEPESLPRKRSAPVKATTKATAKAALGANEDPLLRIEALLKHVEE
jgi:hypothetical protein